MGLISPKCLNDQRAMQYFGDFLDDHKKLSKSRLDAGLAALKACVSQLSSNTGEYTAQTAANVTVTCQVESLPRPLPTATPSDASDDTPRVSLD